jgi:hypothetical protein
MTAYARIEDHTIAEIVTTTGEIGTLFHPSLLWVEVTGPGVQLGWMQGKDGEFAPPPAPSSPKPLLPEPLPPGLAELQADIAALKAQVAQLRTA